MDYESLSKDFDEALAKRDKELEHTRELTRQVDEREFPDINLKSQDFWIMLQDLEDYPDYNPRKLKVMRREGQRRKVAADRHNESIRTH